MQNVLLVQVRQWSGQYSHSPEELVKMLSALSKQMLLVTFQHMVGSQGMSRVKMRKARSTFRPLSFSMES
jgi:hypothetical protein